MVDSKLMRLTKNAVPRQREDQNKEPILPPREGLDKKQNKSHVSVDSQTDSKTMVISKRKRSIEQSKSGLDLYDMLNKK